MKTAITISIAIALSMAAMVPVSAQPAPTAPPVFPVSSSSVGPWIVGGIGLGVLSVMARAAVIGTREDRELTSPEATQAFFLPFVWVLSVDQASPLYFKGVAAEEHYKSVNIPQRQCVGCKSQ